MVTAWQMAIRLPNALKGRRVFSGKASPAARNFIATGDVFKRRLFFMNSESFFKVDSVMIFLLFVVNVH